MKTTHYPPPPTPVFGIPGVRTSDADPDLNNKSRIRIHMEIKIRIRIQDIMVYCKCAEKCKGKNLKLIL